MEGVGRFQVSQQVGVPVAIAEKATDPPRLATGSGCSAPAGPPRQSHPLRRSRDRRYRRRLPIATDRVGSGAVVARRLAVTGGHRTLYDDVQGVGLSPCRVGRKCSGSDDVTEGVMGGDMRATPVTPGSSGAASTSASPFETY